MGRLGFEGCEGDRRDSRGDREATGVVGGEGRWGRQRLHLRKMQRANTQQGHTHTHTTKSYTME